MKKDGQQRAGKRLVYIWTWKTVDTCWVGLCTMVISLSFLFQGQVVIPYQPPFIMVFKVSASLLAILNLIWIIKTNVNLSYRSHKIRLTSIADGVTYYTTYDLKPYSQAKLLVCVRMLPTEQLKGIWWHSSHKYHVYENILSSIGKLCLNYSTGRCRVKFI